MSYGSRKSNQTLVGFLFLDNSHNIISRHDDCHTATFTTQFISLTKFTCDTFHAFFFFIFSYLATVCNVDCLLNPTITQLSIGNKLINDSNRRVLIKLVLTNLQSHDSSDPNKYSTNLTQICSKSLNALTASHQRGALLK